MKPPEQTAAAAWVLSAADAYANDPAFRELAERDPHSALAQHGLDVPREVELRMCQNTEETFHVVLPEDPNRALADQDLMGAVGGSCASSAGSAGSLGTVSSILSCAGSVSSAGSVGSAGTAG